MRSGRTRPFVFVHSSDELYGADRILLDILTALSPEQRRSTQVWLPTDLAHPAAPLCAEVERLGVAVRHLPLPVLRRDYLRPTALAGLGLRTLRLLVRLLAVRAGTVYCTTSTGLVAAPLARVLRVPLVVGHVQELWSPGDARLLAPLARWCHLLLAISEPVAAALPDPVRRRTTVVANATAEPARVVPVASTPGPLRYVVASRWNGWKGHRTLLAAWDRVDQPGELVVLGGPPPSGEAVDVHALVAGLRHPSSVRVVGETAQPHAFVEEADVVVVPSDKPEPFGLVAVEAFARGRPVIGSAAGGLGDVVTDGLDGWTYPPGDVDALADILRRLTRDEVVAAGARARETYEARYTAQRYAADWAAALGREDG